MTDDWRPSGLTLMEDFIAPEREEAIIAIARAAIDVCKDDPLDRKQPKRGPMRRYAHFGFSYDWSQVRYDKAALIPTRPVPDSLKALASEVKATLVVPDAFDAIVVNEYETGGGIHPHVDSSNLAELIAIMSVGEVCTTTFAREDRSFVIHIPRRSLLVMRGQVRYEWTHENKGDPSWRETRYAIVFRSRA